jgi:hypothetical protein
VTYLARDDSSQHFCCSLALHLPWCKLKVPLLYSFIQAIVGELVS